MRALTPRQVHWLLENAPQGEEQFLWDLAALAHSQGDDWEAWFTNFTTGAGPHGVNNAQALKSAAVWWRQSANSTLPVLSRDRMDNMDRVYGMPTGYVFWCPTPRIIVSNHPT